jgi:hypothetical protein
MMKLVEVRGRRLQSHPCENAARNQQMARKGKDMYHLRLDVTRQPNVFVGVLSETGEKSEPFGEEVRMATHHVCIGAEVIPSASNGQVTLTAAGGSETHRF